MFSNILSIIFICCVAFVFFQCYEFVRYYNYIVSFNDRYSNYEFDATPGYNYVDKSFFDPNDTSVPQKEKWRCAEYQDNWYGVSSSGLALQNKQYMKTETEIACIRNLFAEHYVFFNNPCIGLGSTSEICNVFNNIKPV